MCGRGASERTSERASERTNGANVQQFVHPQAAVPPPRVREARRVLDAVREADFLRPVVFETLRSSALSINPLTHAHTQEPLIRSASLSTSYHRERFRQRLKLAVHRTPSVTYRALRGGTGAFPSLYSSAEAAANCSL